MSRRRRKRQPDPIRGRGVSGARLGPAKAGPPSTDQNPKEATGAAQAPRITAESRAGSAKPPAPVPRLQDPERVLSSVCSEIETMRAACFSAKGRWNELPDLTRRAQAQMSCAGHFFDETASRINSLLGDIATQITQAATETRSRARVVSEELSGVYDSIETMERAIYEADHETSQLEEELFKVESCLAEFTLHRPRDIPTDKRTKDQIELRKALAATLGSFASALKACGEEHALYVTERAVQELGAIGPIEAVRCA